MFETTNNYNGKKVIPSYRLDKFAILSVKGTELNSWKQLGRAMKDAQERAEHTHGSLVFRSYTRNKNYKKGDAEFVYTDTVIATW
jgi:hypothetical protein